MNRWKDVLVMFGVALSTTLAWHTFRWYMITYQGVNAAGVKKTGWLYTQQDVNPAIKDQYVKSLEQALRRSANQVIADNSVKAYKSEPATEAIKMYKGN